MARGRAARDECPRHRRHAGDVGRTARSGRLRRSRLARDDASVDDLMAIEGVDEEMAEQIDWARSSRDSKWRTETSVDPHAGGAPAGDEEGRRGLHGGAQTRAQPRARAAREREPKTPSDARGSGRGGRRSVPRMHGLRQSSRRTQSQAGTRTKRESEEWLEQRFESGHREEDGEVQEDSSSSCSRSARESKANQALEPEVIQALITGQETDPHRASVDHARRQAAGRGEEGSRRAPPRRSRQAGPPRRPPSRCRRSGRGR